MSTPTAPRRTAKTAAKRRAAARKRNREVGRQLFAYVVIAILIISTIATVLVVPLTQQPANAVPTATPDQANQLKQLVTLGDQQLAAGNYFTATLYYEAYTQQNPTDAAVQLKLAKAILQGPNPNYPEAQRALQQAASVSGPQQQEAQALLTQIGPTVAALPTAPITGTQTITGTALPSNPSGAIPATSTPANK